ncbi:MAG: hypothetical protein MRJ93_14440 [Nitrososphaeraceae archaeon]|nr:hypothetical protein [Nitrososphaeraceae archaeon]
MIITRKYYAFPCLQHSSTALNSGEPTGKSSTLMVSLFSPRYCFVILEQLGVALSTNIMDLLNCFCICFR